ncbi:MAG: DUF1998 domain-containing protein [Enhygromyxa sp.]
MASKRSSGRRRKGPASKQSQTDAPDPEGEVRRSQVITTYGPGSMVDLVDHAVLMGGLDFWRWRKGGKRTIAEPRLREAIAAKLAEIGGELDLAEPFREPPAGGEDPSLAQGIEVLQFPRWFVCQGCRALVGRRGLELKDGRLQHECGRRRWGETIPMRFVAACTKGHLQDYPWVAFVHEMQQQPRCVAPSLILDEGVSGDFSEIWVRCECGTSRKLADAMSPGAGPACRGARPWLGRDADEGCEVEHMRLMVRTASNSYFAQTVSALSLPEPGRELERALEPLIKDLEDITAIEHLALAKKFNKALAAVLEGVDDELAFPVITSLREGKSLPREKLRVAEFKQFTQAKDEIPGDLPKPADYFFARRARLEQPPPAGIAEIILAHKLREVRAQVGFTRIEPSAPNLEGEYDLGVAVQRLGSTHERWLPAIEVFGEGIFIRLDDGAVHAWEQREQVRAREEQLRRGWEEWKQANFPDATISFPGARFYMLHSLAHLLISAISLECGYAASSIRERIYCAEHEAETKMAAILLMTGTTGSEGTLGGLVEQGRNIAEHLRSAWRLGSLCSNDPICADHSPAGDHAERHLEGAACHGCLFIAEPSCERNNGFLDRALVVPTIGRDPQLAFFSECP